MVGAIFHDGLLENLESAPRSVTAKPSVCAWDEVTVKIAVARTIARPKTA